MTLVYVIVAARRVIPIATIWPTLFMDVAMALFALMMVDASHKILMLCMLLVHVKTSNFPEHLLQQVVRISIPLKHLPAVRCVLGTCFSTKYCPSLPFINFVY
jgi:hypothetical protein